MIYSDINDDDKSMSGWLKLLNVASTVQRKSILQTLCNNHDGINLTLSILESVSDEDLRDSIVYYLKECGQGIDNKIQKISRLLKNENSKVRMSAVELLQNSSGKIQSREQLLLLLDSLLDSDELVVLHAGLAIFRTCKKDISKMLVMDARSGLSWEQWYKHHSGDKTISAPIVLNLALNRIDSIYVQKILKNSSILNRRALALAILKNDQLPRDLLLSLLDDADPIIRCFALRYIGINFSSAEVSVLIVSCNDSNFLVRSESAFVLADLCLDQEMVRPVLFRMLRDSHPRVRFASVVALSLYDTVDTETITIFYDLLSDDDTNVRSEVVRALSSSNDPELTINKVILLLFDTSEKVRVAAFQTLVSLASKLCGNESLISVLISLYEDVKDNEVRVLLLTMFERMQNVSPLVLPVLSTALLDSVTSVRSAAVDLLRRCEITSDTLTRSIAIALKDPEPYIRKQILRFLFSSPFVPDFYRPVLIDTLGDTDSEVCLLASQAILKLFPDVILPIITLSVILLSKTNCEIRRLAARALRNCQKDTEIVRSVLSFVSNDKDRGVAAEASRSLIAP